MGRLGVCFALVVLVQLCGAATRLPLVDRSMLQARSAVSPQEVLDAEPQLIQDTSQADSDVRVHSGFLPIDPNPPSAYEGPPVILPEHDDVVPVPSGGVLTSPSPSPSIDPSIGPVNVDWLWGKNELPSPSNSPVAPSPAWPVDAAFSNMPWELYSRSISASVSPSSEASSSASRTRSISRSQSPSQSAVASTSLTPSISRSSSRTHSTTPSSSPTPSVTPSVSPTSHASKTPRPSHSPRPSNSPTPTFSRAPSMTPYPNLEAIPETFIPHAEERSYQNAEDNKPWSYDEHKKNGPSKWSSLTTSFKTCAAAKQSPIDLSEFSIASSSFPLLTLNYQVGNLLLRNNGKYIRIINHRSSSARLGNKKYNLMYIGIHSPSEHTINGESFPAELQFIHKSESADGQLLALSVLLDAGDGELEHPLLSAVLSDTPAKVAEAFADSVFDLSSALPLDISSNRGETQVSYPYFTYEGTLTTPPCNENVRWLIWGKPDHISNAQIEKLNNLAPRSRRPLQSRDGRTVWYKNLFV